MKNQKKVETRSSIIEQLDGGIVKIIRKKGVEMGAADLDELLAVYQNLLKNEKGKFLLLVDNDCESEFDFIAKMADPKRAKVKKAEAIIVHSLGKRLEANFYIKKYKPEHPVAIFSAEQEGLDWLRAIK